MVTEPLGVASPGRTVDGDLGTAWESDAGVAGAVDQVLTLDLATPTCLRR